MDRLEPAEVPESSQERTEHKRARITELGSIVALATSFFALSLSAYQARLMNEQTRLMQNRSRASVSPYVAIGYSINDEGASRGYTWQISNDGAGPARVESVTMTLDGKPVHSWREVFRALYGDAKVTAMYSQLCGRCSRCSAYREPADDDLAVLGDRGACDSSSPA